MRSALASAAPSQCGKVLYFPDFRFVVDDHEFAVAGLVHAVGRTGQPDLPARQIDRKGWLIIAAEGMLDVPWYRAARAAVRVVSDQHLAKLPPPPRYLNRPRRGPAGLAFGEHPVRLFNEHLLCAGVLGRRPGHRWCLAGLDRRPDQPFEHAVHRTAAFGCIELVLIGLLGRPDTEHVLEVLTPTPP